MKKFLSITKKAALVILACVQAMAVIGSLLIAAGFLYVDYFQKPHNKKADDEISRAVYEAVGAKEIYYQGKSEGKSGNTTIYYAFHVRKEKTGLAEEAVAAINTVLEQENISSNISVQFMEEIPGGQEPLFGLCNYIDYKNPSADYGKLQYLWIYGTRHRTQDSIYNDPETYENIPDIRYLKVSEKIQKAADEKGIDWHEYWPELETIEVIPR